MKATFEEHWFENFDRKVMETIWLIWCAHPDLRFGQLILNAVHEDELYHIDDDKLLSKLCKCYGVDVVEPQDPPVSIIDTIRKEVEKHGNKDM